MPARNRRRAPDVSVVIPTRGRPDLVVLAARSCVEPGVEVEVVVVDDGGEDDTEAALAELEPRPRYVWQPWAGRSAARNRGVALARAPLVAFLDSDDLSLPGRFGRQLPRLHDGAVGAWGQIVHVGLRGEPLPAETAVAQARIAAVAAAGASAARLAVTMAIFPSTVVLRRETFEAVGGFDPAFDVSEDVEFLLRVAHRGRLAFEPSPVAAIRVHEGNTGSDRMFRAHVELAAKLVRAWPAPADAPVRARLLLHQARALWSTGQTERARAASLAALREDASVLFEPGFAKRLLGSLLPQERVNALRGLGRDAA